METTERKPGYYWVKLDDKWVVGNFNPGPGSFHWRIHGIISEFSDDDFQEINETPIFPDQICPALPSIAMPSS